MTRATARRVLLGVLLSFYVTTQASYGGYLCVEDPDTGEVLLERDHSNPSPLSHRDMGAIKEFVSSTGGCKSRLLFGCFKSSVIPEIENYMRYHPQMTVAQVDRLLMNRLQSTAMSCISGSLLIATFVGYNDFFPLIKDETPSLLEPCLEPLKLLGSLNILSPFIEPLMSNVRYGIFRISSKARSTASAAISATLESIWYRMQQSYSPNGDVARKHLSLAENSTLISITGLAIDSALVPQQRRAELIYTRIALIALKFKDRFDDIDPWDSHMDIEIRERLSLYPELLKEEAIPTILEILRKIDSEFNELRYDAILKTWLPEQPQQSPRPKTGAKTSSKDNLIVNYQSYGSL